MSSQTASLRLPTATSPRPRRAGLRRVLAALALVASCSAAATVMTPTQAPVLRQFTTAQGLPLDGVNDVLQTRDGYLWVATFDGLARFDGNAFTLFPVGQTRTSSDAGPAPTDGPPSQRTTVLMEDRRGRLWIGTEDSGLGLLDHGDFLHLPTCGRQCQINALIEGNDGIWVASDQGLWRVDPEALRSEPVLHSPRSLTGLALDASGAIWVTASAWLARVDAAGAQPVTLPPELRDIGQISAAGDVLLLASSADLFTYTPATGLWRQLQLGPIRRVSPLGDGHLMVSLHDGRVLRLDQQLTPTRVADLGAIRPFRATRSDDGSLWISSSGGLLRLHAPSIATLGDPALGMAAPGRAIAPDGAGGYWFAFNCDGLRHWRADGELEDWSTRLPPRWHCVETLHLGRSGTLWAGSSGGDVLRLSARRDAAPQERLRGTAALPVHALYEEADGSLLVASQRETRRLAPNAPPADSGSTIPALTDLTVRQIVPSQRGGLWFVGDHGALRLEDGEVRERWGPEQGLSSRFARALHEAADGTLWIGTYGGGLNRIRNGRVDIYTRRNGLSDDTVSCIEADRDGQLWLAGNRGVAVLDPATVTPTEAHVRAYGVSDGLTPPEINGGNQASCLTDAQERIWLSLVRGFALFDPRRMDTATEAPPAVHIERVAVAGVTRDPRLPLDLTPDARSIEIGYTGIEFSHPERVQFRYRLAGLRDSWSDADANRSVVYPTLPFGNYRFQVQARREGEAWPDTWAELPIAHPAPWYQRPWVWLVSTLLALVLLLDTGRPRRAAPAPDP